uniref:Uncharacterized protein n=1 Tax=Oryza sativa subsp. japonica TaxID=39947 RepID=Q69UY3_ORYSJ|nr:hypothetical protein [Oryza sativa Japonica Group]
MATVATSAQGAAWRGGFVAAARRLYATARRRGGGGVAEWVEERRGVFGLKRDVTWTLADKEDFTQTPLEGSISRDRPRQKKGANTDLYKESTSWAWTENATPRASEGDAAGGGGGLAQLGGGLARRYVLPIPLPDSHPSPASLATSSPPDLAARPCLLSLVVAAFVLPLGISNVQRVGVGTGDAAAAPRPSGSAAHAAAAPRLLGAVAAPWLGRASSA